MTQVNTPGQPVQIRLAVYIDGFNLYFGIRSSGLGRYGWLDLCAFAENLKKPEQRVVAVRYFTARVSTPDAKRRRQNAYLDALSTLDPTLFSIAYGKYQVNQSRCLRCGAQSDIPNEKQTDVNIAVAILSDAFKERFDHAILVSADSDLCPVVSTIRTLFPAKKVIVAFPPGRASKELRGIASACFTIGRTKLSQSQFPDAIKMQNGFVLTKPPLWNTPEYQRPR